MRALARSALGALVVSAAIAAGAQAPPVDSYRAAASRGETGAVEVRAYTERRKPDGPDTPLRDAVVTLVPYSDPLLAEVERVKQHARDSLRTYRAAALQVRRLEEAYEKTLWEAGAADLVRSSLVGPDGRFAFSDVAAGRWILWASHEVLSPVTPRPPKRADAKTFALSPKLVGFRTASYWLVPVTVSGGASVTVELTDRNVWFTGVVEETVSQK